MEKVTPVISEYKGHPTIGLRFKEDDEKYTFTFGVRKAQLILAYLDEIKQFVESQNQTKVA